MRLFSDLTFNYSITITMESGKFDPRNSGELLKYSSLLCVFHYVTDLLFLFFELFFELLLCLCFWWIGIWISRMRSLWKHTDPCCMKCKNFRLLYFTCLHNPFIGICSLTSLVVYILPHSWLYSPINLGNDYSLTMATRTCGWHFRERKVMFLKCDIISWWKIQLPHNFGSFDVNILTHNYPAYWYISSLADLSCARDWDAYITILASLSFQCDANLVGNFIFPWTYHLIPVSCRKIVFPFNLSYSCLIYLFLFYEWWHILTYGYCNIWWHILSVALVTVKCLLLRGWEENI